MQTLGQQRITKLEEIFRKKDEVLSAYLFGSMAEGHQNRRSDVDIAVLVKPGLNAIDKHKIRMDLIESIEQFFGRQADIVVLNDASLKMKHQVFSHGKPIYIENDLKEESFRLRSQKEYFDFQYYLEKERRDLRAFYEC